MSESYITDKPEWIKEEHGIIGHVLSLINKYSHSKESQRHFLISLAQYDADDHMNNKIAEIISDDYISASEFGESLQRRFTDEAFFYKSGESFQKNSIKSKAEAFDSINCFFENLDNGKTSAAKAIKDLKKQLQKLNEDINGSSSILGYISSLTSGISSEDRQQFNNDLCTLLKNKKKYMNKSFRYYTEKDFSIKKQTDVEEKKKAKRVLKESLKVNYPDTDRITIIRYIKLKNSDKEDTKRNLSQNIFLVLYFAVLKKLPPYMQFGESYAEHLSLFSDKVTSQYGTISEPGIRQIIALANDSEKPNIIAQYEYADLLYYGSTNGPKKNIEKAFSLYKDLTQCIPPHPLAFWSLAYIYLNHGNANTELEDPNCIPALKNKSKEYKVEKAAYYAIESFLKGKNPAAANILGKIYQLDEEIASNIQDIKDEIAISTEFKSAQECFEYAAEHGYLYANGNLAKIYQLKLLDNKYEDDKEAKRDLKKYEQYLRVSADMYDPWALNLLGKLYYDKCIKDPVSNRKSVELTINEHDNEPIARKFFERAIKQYRNKNSIYAFTNLLLLFPDHFKNKETLKINIDQVVDYVNKVKQSGNINAINQLREGFESTWHDFIRDKNDIRKIMSLLDDETTSNGKNNK